MIPAIPRGWVKTTLGEIRSDQSISVDPRRSPDEEFELYSIPAYATETPEIVKGADIGSSKRTLAPGTVIVSKINPRINRVWVVGEHGSRRLIGSSEWIPFFPLPGLCSQFLAYFLQQNDFRNYLAANASGVGGSLMRVRPDTLNPFPFLLPPEREQHRIVEAIESYLSRLDAAIAALERVKKDLERYRKSVLKAAVEGRLVPTEAELARREGRDYEPASVLLERILKERRRKWEEAELAKYEAKGKKPPRNWRDRYKEPAQPNTSELPELPEGWCWACVHSIAEHRLGKMLDKSKNTGVLRPYLRNINTRWFSFDLSDLAEMRITDEEYPNVSVQRGDLVVCEGGEPGRCAVWLDTNTIAIQKALHRIRPYSGVSSQYLAIVLAANALSGRLERTFTGSGIKHLTGQSLRSYPVPLPPCSEQLRIVEHVQYKLSIKEQVERQVSDNLSRAHHLRQSILKWAFEGKLADQDPDDEPASVLLERIKAKRAADNNRSRRKRGGKGAIHG